MGNFLWMRDFRVERFLQPWRKIIYTCEFFTLIAFRDDFESAKKRKTPRLCTEKNWDWQREIIIFSIWNSQQINWDYLQSQLLKWEVIPKLIRSDPNSVRRCFDTHKLVIMIPTENVKIDSWVEMLLERKQEEISICGSQKPDQILFSQNLRF